MDSPPPSAPMASSSTATKRPTTPLRRVSRGALRALSLSHSRNRALAGEPEPALAHLAPIFAELADAVSILAETMGTMQKVGQGLDGFNEAFGAYLYGLRMNSYTAEFTEAPAKFSFDLHALSAQQQHDFSPPPSPTQQQQQQDDADNHHLADSTMRTMDDTFLDAHGSDSTPRAGAGGTRGRGGTTTRGRGRGRGGKAPAMTKKRKEENLAFAAQVIELLPIKFREQQPARGEMETVISLLRENPNGLTMESFKTLAPQVPTHRVNEALTELTRAKHTIRTPGKPVSWRLDSARWG